MADVSCPGEFSAWDFRSRWALADVQRAKHIVSVDGGEVDVNVEKHEKNLDGGFLKWWYLWVP